MNLRNLPFHQWLLPVAQARRVADVGDVRGGAMPAAGVAGAAAVIESDIAPRLMNLVGNVRTALSLQK